jgi:RNA polymerase sigma factor (sigma-70 family)
MAAGQLTTVVDQLRRTALRPDVAGLTDAELLGAFVVRRDAAAFATLVHRHGSMVFGVCRRVLGNSNDAEDAFQATFLVLVRRAAAVAPRERVASWLFGVAYKTARAARRMLARHRAREKQVSRLPDAVTDMPQTQRDLKQVLDRELSSLPDKLRLPIVLCDLEGRTVREAARELGTPVGTLSNRLAAGRQRLGQRLTRRGIAIAAGVTGLLYQEAAAQAPARLIANTLQTALQVAAMPAALTAIVTPEVATLTQGAVHTMGYTKFKFVALVLMSVGILGAGTAWTTHSPPDQIRSEPAAQTVVAQTVAAQKKDAVKPAAEQSQQLLNQALKQFDDAGDEMRGLRHRLLADMAVLQARLGDRAAARKLFEKASEIVAAVEERGQSGEWRTIARAQATAGEVEDAVATARRIAATDHFREITLREIASELADKRQETEALRVGALVEDAKTQAWFGPMLQEQLALAHAAAGDFVQALRVVERMKEPASQVIALAGPIYFNLTFAESPEKPGVALLQAKAGDNVLATKTLQRAADLVSAMPDAEKKSRPLTALACAQARLGDFDAARKTTESITHKDGKAIALGTLVRELAKAGRAKEALVEIDKLPVGVTQVHALTHLAMGQAKSGDKAAAVASFDRAHFLLGQLSENDRRSQAHNVASGRAVGGDYKGAEQTAKAYLPDDSLGAVNIVYARAEAGDFAGALEAAKQMKDSDWWKGNVVRAIAKLQTERGQSQAALEWIDRLDAPLARANALFGVAEGLVAAKK